MVAWNFQTSTRLAIVFLQIVLLSGLPMPVLDSHPTDPLSVADSPALLAHLQFTPTAEHSDVEDQEWHVHWVSLYFGDGIALHDRTWANSEFMAAFDVEASPWIVAGKVQDAFCWERNVIPTNDSPTRAAAFSPPASLIAFSKLLI